MAVTSRPESSAWSAASWRRFPAAQQPVWPDADALKKAEARLSTLPPLVFAGEARHLTTALGDVANGEAFLLQAGDCAESFADFSADSIRDKLKIILQMAVALTYAAGVPVVKVGRIAGQFAKPRSAEGQRYERIASEIDRALRFMAACGIDLAAEEGLHQVDFWTSHEALILNYEECLTRRDSLTGDWYDCSAHMVWIGDRTRQLDGAHVEFFSGICNPVGCKVGPGCTPEEVVELCERLNPDRLPGRLTLITRLGAGNVRDLLPPLVRAVEAEGHPVVWACDPMHGNTFTSNGGRKTRRLDDILLELRSFFDVHRDEGTWPGGLHVELTGDDVTECLGGAEEILEGDLDIHYTTSCDPRLNARQSLDLAFRVAEFLRS